MSPRHDSLAPWFQTVMSRGHSRKWVRGVFQHSKRCKNTIILRNTLYLFFHRAGLRGARGQPLICRTCESRGKPGKTGENRGDFRSATPPYCVTKPVIWAQKTGHEGQKTAITKHSRVPLKRLPLSSVRFSVAHCGNSLVVYRSVHSCAIE